MASKSIYVQYLDNIQKVITPVLKAKGYTRKGRTYNRVVDKGIVHVIHFQSGQYPIGDYVIPGVRESSYGTFAIPVGVFIKEVHETKESRPVPEFVRDYDCSIRSDVAEIIRRKTDWRLDENYANTANELVLIFENQLTKWFDNFLERKQIIQSLQNTKIKNLLVLTGRLNAAIIQFQTNRKAGIGLLKEHYIASNKHKGHQEYVRELAKKMGITPKEFDALK